MADEVCEVRRLSGHSGGVWSVAFSGDGEWLATGSFDKTVKLWNRATGECVRTCTGHVSSVFSVAFSEDGKWVASASGDKTARVWDKETGRCTRTCAGHSSHVCAVAISADGEWLASGSYDKTVRLWNPATGELVRSCAGAFSTVLALAFSPDGALLASGSRDTSVRLWNPAVGAFVRACEGHSDWVWAVAFAKSGKVLASGSEDKTMRLWDAASGACLRTFAGHSDTVYSVAFSPDGKWLASGSSDKTVRLWDVESGVCMRIIEGHSEWVNSVAFSTDGNWLASGSGDQTARLWDTSSLKCGDKGKAEAQFFTCLVECDKEGMDVYKTLDKLQPLVKEISELKLFYTFASAALRNGEITAGQRKQFVCDVLNSISECFKFDQKSEVITMLTRTVLPACERDGLIDGRERERLTHEFTRGNVFADYRYRRLEEIVALHSQQIGALQSAVESAHRRINDVIEYANSIDNQLQEFKAQYRKHLKRKSTIAMVSGLISMIPFAGGVLNKALDGVVDLSSATEIMCMASNFVGGHEKFVELIEDKGGVWAERPLKQAVREHGLIAPEIAALGMIQMMNAVDDGKALRELDELYAKKSKPKPEMREIEFTDFSIRPESRASKTPSDVNTLSRGFKDSHVSQQPKVAQSANYTTHSTSGKDSVPISGPRAWKAAFNEMCEMMDENELEFGVAAGVASELLKGSISFEKIKAVLGEKDFDKSGTCNVAEFLYAMKILTQ
mmetsp:Transcript_2109/g.5674  ORF Transcript_2109/g.5674 Transcript_2109/m.5674 type:complete len:732 (-) Transcript_2109:220-2415(-)